MSERRAPTQVKTGVEIELKTCPYRDDRRGRPMNVSALEQVTRHLNAALASVASFRTAQRADHNNRSTDWSHILCAVLDQLAAPALHLLFTQNLEAPVPAPVAVSHKVGAGFVAVARELCSMADAGAGKPVTVDALVEYTCSSKALFGRSEVCAGPMPLIERASEVLIHGLPEAEPAKRLRVQLAKLFTEQIRIGQLWHRFDLDAERKFLQNLGRHPLVPRNNYVQRQLDTRITELELAPKEHPTRLPSDIMDLGAIDCALQATQSALDPRPVRQLLELKEGGLLIESADATSLVMDFLRYLDVYRCVLSRLWHNEESLRQLLELPMDPEFELHPAILPTPKAMHWYEVLLGHNLRTARQPEFALRLKNHRRQVALT